MHRIYYEEITPYFNESYFQECMNMVPENRRAKVQALKSAGSRAASLAAGMILVKAARELGIESELDHITVGEHGKPDFRRDCGFHYNISHSGDYVMLAIADKPVGVDIQLMKPLARDIASRFYSSDEIDYLNEISKDISSLEYMEAFYRIWCLKESYVKCSGKGLGQGLDSFSVLDRLDDSSIIMDGRYASAICIF